MPFIDIARAIYAYTAASTDELSIEENDLLYVLEKGDDDWWKVKKKVEGDDDGPVGLVPRNYLEDVPSLVNGKTLYDYTAQTEEELSFAADLPIEIFDKDDPDWFLVRLKESSSGQWEYGFVPSNYLDDGEVEDAAKLPSVIPAGRPDSLDERRPLTPPPAPEEEDDEPISPSNAMSAYGRPEQHYSVRDPKLDAKFKTWKVEEIDSRKRRRRGTLGVGNMSIVWSCEASRTPVQTWPITSLIEYNTEKKHLFIELSSPPTPASFHFHAESRAVATEISDAIGEIAGATRATGLREVAAASGDPLPPLPETSALAQRHKREDSDDLPIDDGIKRGVILYDFDAQGDDELACRQDQIVEILDDSHEEWWKCKAGSHEGVVPASYVEVIKTRPAPAKEKSTPASALAAVTTQSRPKSTPRSASPPAQSSSNRQNLSKPDMGKIRTWTDRSGTFKVEAQFLGLADGKIQLHKLNGVKISVPLSKMSVDDVHFVERLTGRNNSPPPPKPPPDSEKPRSKKIDYDWFTFFLDCGVDYNVCQRYAGAFERDQMDESILPDINPDTLRTLGVREGDILRIMKKLDEKFGRTNARKKSVRFGDVEDEEKDELAEVVKLAQPTERRERLFSSGPGGALRNNTQRRGRPTTSKTAPEEVDGSLLTTPAGDNEEQGGERERHGVRPLRVPASRLANYKEPGSQRSSSEGFEDDAWAVKQKTQAETPSAPPAQSPRPSPPSQTGPPPGSAIHELAAINTQTPAQTLPPPLQPQITPVQIQISPQPTASPLVNRPSSVPPGQSAPQMAPLQPHYTGLPPQQQFVAPTPAQASGVPSLNEQLVKLQIYRQQQQQQQQMLQPQQTGYLQQFQPQQTGYVNGYTSQNFQLPQQTGMTLPPQPTGMSMPLQQTGMQLQPQQTGMQLQPQATGYVPSFLPPGQRSSQLGPTRSFSAGLPPSLIPTNTLSPPGQPQFLTAHRTGPANFAPTPQFQQPQPAGFQPQQTGFQPQPLQQQMTGFPPQQQPQATGLPSFLPPQGLLPQQTGFGQQMLPPQSTGMKPDFKPVSFGTTPKPLVPSRTGKRANLAAATPENPFGF